MPPNPLQTPDALLQQGLAAHRAGDLARADALYHEALTLAPAHPDAHHLLGLLALQQKDHPAAIERFQTALALAPGTSRFHLSLGKAHFAAGALPAAAAAFAQATARDPAMTEAFVLLAGTLAAQGQHAQAAAALTNAAAQRPADPEIHCNLSAMLIATGRWHDGIAAAQTALRLHPGHLPALVNLGSALRHANQLDTAAAAFHEALQHDSASAEAWLGLGAVLRAQKKTDAALAAFARAALLAPARFEPHLEAGETLAEAGRHAPAIVELHAAIARNPDSAAAVLALGAALYQIDNVEDSLAALQRAAALAPDLPEVHYNLGIVHAALRGPHAAIGHYEKALRLRPDYAAAHVNLAEALRMSGRVAEAMPHVRRAVELQPENSLAHSALLYALHYCEGTTPEALLAEHRRWAQRHVEPLCAGVTHANSPDPNRRLRLGYVSPDLYDHPLARYILPILDQHDHQQFEVFLYSSAKRSDLFSQRCRAAADHFRPVAHLSDDALASLVREDHIDILVDLSQHMGGNHMLAFARKPAPVQFAGFGYPSTTGSPAIDARISDPYIDPPAHPLAGPEALARMPHSFWCFSPHNDAEPVHPRPALTGSPVTFASLNNPAKTTSLAIDHWSAVLHAVPHSRLLLLSGSPGDPQILAAFTTRGIDPARITFLPRVSRAAYLAYYHLVDIVVDPYPYTGHSTSCDAFYMGVPVLTLTGGNDALPVSRAGASLLHALQLPELIAQTPAALARIAAALAHDLPRLHTLSTTLRPRMQKSPLMDAPAYTRALETHYRQAWTRWCK